MRIATMASMQAITPKIIVLVESEPELEFREGEVVVFEDRLVRLEGNRGMAWTDISCSF